MVNGKKWIESCLVVRGKGKKQPSIILKRDTCINKGLVTMKSVNNIEKEEFGIEVLDIPSQEEMVKNIVDEAKEELTPILIDYVKNVDVTKTADVEEFSVILLNKDDLPKKQPIYPIPIAYQDFARKEINELLKRNHIVPTKSAAPAPTV
ncbi:hypothetical protein ADUPG1_003788, partial [Aduncisulcus paluster]